MKPAGFCLREHKENCHLELQLDRQTSLFYFSNAESIRHFCSNFPQKNDLELSSQGRFLSSVNEKPRACLDLSLCYASFSLFASSITFMPLPSTLPALIPPYQCISCSSPTASFTGSWRRAASWAWDFSSTWQRHTCSGWRNWPW